MGEYKPRLFLRFVVDGTPASDWRVNGEIAYLSPKGSHIHEFESRASSSGTIVAGPLQGFEQATDWSGKFIAFGGNGSVFVGRGSGTLPQPSAEAAKVDIVLLPQPEPVSGRTVTESGEAVWGAVVTIQESIPGDDRWFPRDDLSTGTDSEGRFQIPVPDRGTMVRLVVRASGRCTSVQEVVPGEKGLEIVMSAESTVSGRVVMDYLHSESQLIAELAQTGDPESPSRLASDIMENGRFLIHGIRRGTYSFTILSRNSREVLWELNSIDVDNSEDNDDPRLNPIDLRGLTYEYQIHVYDALGKIIPNAMIKVESTDGFRRQLHSTKSPTSSVTLVTRHPEVRVIVSVPGHEDTSLTASPGSVAVKVK